MSRMRERLWGPFLICMALTVAVPLLVWMSYWPPGAAVERHEPAVVASGSRAAVVLDRVLDGIGAHPTGTWQNRLVRDRLIDELRRIGLEPQIQRGFACSSRGACADVENIVARIESGSDDAVLIAAHYDSVPAGAGAGDDLSGTSAVIETARAILARGEPGHDVIILLSDGEELGLLGAELFAAEHPWREDVRWMVNIEARGTTGPLLLFETSEANQPVIAAVASMDVKLVSNSILYTIYRLLPNDTDFSVGRRAGWIGMNMALIGGGSRYHTSRDDRAHLDRRSLAHGTALFDASVQSILEASPAEGSGDAVYFDVLGRFLVGWPAGFTLPLAIVTAVGFLGLGVVAARRTGGLKAGRAFSWSGAITGIAAVALFGWWYLLRALGALDAAWPAEPHWLFLSCGALCVLLLLLAFRVAGHLTLWGGWIAVWTLPVAASVILAALLPGVAFVVLVPSAVAVISGAIGSFLPRRVGISVATVVPFAVNWLIICSLLWQFYLGLGSPLLPGMGLIVVTSLLSMVILAAGARAPWWLVVGLLLLMVLAGGGATLRSPWSESSPQPVNVQLVRIDEEAFFTLTAGAPEQMVELRAFGTEKEKVFPFDTRPTLLRARAPRELLDLPDVEIVYREGSVRFRITPTADDANIGLFFPVDAVSAAEVRGHTISMEKVPDGGQRVRGVRVTSPGEPVEITLLLTGADAFAAWAYERRSGMPEGDDLVAARPAEASAIHDGDRTIAMRTVHVQPARR